MYEDIKVSLFSVGIIFWRTGPGATEQGGGQRKVLSITKSDLIVTNIAISVNKSALLVNKSAISVKKVPFQSKESALSVLC